MKSVIHKITREFLYHVASDNYLANENEEIVDFIPDSLTEEQQLAIKNNQIAVYDQQQYSELRPTDWYFIRKQDTGEEVPEGVKAQRTAIRLKYDNLKSQL